MSINSMLEKTLEQVLALPKKKVLISSHGQFATLNPQEISTNPELIRAVETGDVQLIEEEILRLGREHDTLHPEEGYTHEFDKHGNVVGTRRKTDNEIGRRFWTCSVTALHVVEVQGKYRLHFDYDLFEEVVQDQATIIRDLLELKYE